MERACNSGGSPHQGHDQGVIISDFALHRRHACRFTCTKFVGDEEISYEAKELWRR